MKKKSAGRPKQCLDVLPEGWQAHILSLYSVGASDVEIKAWISTQKDGCSNDLFSRWLKEEPLFSETIKRGRQLSQCWWESQAREHLISYHKGPQFNAVLWYMNMKNRFGWADKQTIEHEGIENIPIVIIDGGPNPYRKDNTD